MWRRARRRLHVSALIEQANASAASRRPMLVQCGYGESSEREGLSLGAAQHNHGPRNRLNATSAAVRACRNALGLNTSPGGWIDHYLRCYPEQLHGIADRVQVHVKLGVPEGHEVDRKELRAVFPYGRLLPLEIVGGGMTYECDASDCDNGTSVIVVVAAVAISEWLQSHQPASVSRAKSS